MKETLLREISNYENWISSGLKGDQPQNVRKELFKLFHEDPNAYTFYRNYLFLLSMQLDNEGNELSDFMQFMNHSCNLAEHADLINHFSSDDILSTFETQRMNIMEIASEISKPGITHTSCYLYQCCYECETILIVLASIGKLNTKFINDFSHSNLRDSSGNLKKGVCVDFINAKLKKNPLLEKLVSSAYNPKLRNTIGHNNYSINNNTIVSRDGNIIVPKEDLFESLYNLQKLNNFLLYFFSGKSNSNTEFQDCGVLSIGFGSQDEKPVLIIHQLSCFFEIDIQKRWLNNVEFIINDNNLTTKLTNRTPMKGSYNNEIKDWFNSLNEVELLKVIIQPIMPQIDKEADIIEIDCGRFQICDTSHEVEIKYELKYVP